SAAEHWDAVQAKAAGLDFPARFVSAATQDGVRDLMRLVAEKLAELPAPEPLTPDVPVFTLDESESEFTVEKRSDGYHVEGVGVRRLVAQTYWDMPEAVERAQLQLETMGVLAALREAGVQAGDTVFLADMELEWVW
ncbi:MAG TPA: DUF1967 domain-containing protein, partial [Anaerolineae bacterium]|nr:DUF1967 domain-containing protein [Anaerolineae bacterium]